MIITIEKFRIMKKLSIILPIFALLFLRSCRDIANSVLDILPPFNTSFSSTQQVPFAAVSTTSYTRTPEIPMNVDMDAKIKEQNSKYGIDNLKSVRMTSLTATYIGSKLGVKLDAVKNMRIYIKAPNLPEKLIATADNNTSADKIVFTTTNADIADYFKTKENSLIIEVMGNYASADIVTIQMDAGFEVRAQL